ncbi:MAG: hypothetical protein ABL874_08180 [Sphingopyxis sp.]
MRPMIFSLLLALTAPALSAPSVADAQAAQGDVDGLLARARAIYDRAAEPELSYDVLGRLLIYRQALAELENGLARYGSDARVMQQRNFYRGAIAEVLAATGGTAEAQAIVSLALPSASELHTANPNNLTYAYDYARLLRTRVTMGMAARQHGTVREDALQVVALFEQVLVSDPRSYEFRRLLAVDLDNAAEIARIVGDVSGADPMSQRALDLFREMAVELPDDRRTQGSLLIALIRRAQTLRSLPLLDEADDQIAAMRTRGLLTERYANMPGLVSRLRAEFAGGN